MCGYGCVGMSLCVWVWVCEYGCVGRVCGYGCVGTGVRVWAMWLWVGMCMWVWYVGMGIWVWVCGYGPGGSKRATESKHKDTRCGIVRCVVSSLKANHALSLSLSLSLTHTHTHTHTHYKYIHYSWWGHSVRRKHSLTETRLQTHTLPSLLLN